MVSFTSVGFLYLTHYGTDMVTFIATFMTDHSQKKKKYIFCDIVIIISSAHMLLYFRPEAQTQTTTVIDELGKASAKVIYIYKPL